MPVGSGISSQIGGAQEVTPGTQVTVTKFWEHNGETLELDPTTIQGRGLHAGGQYLRGSRRARTTRQVKGNVMLNFPNKGAGFWLQNMLGSFGQTLATPTQIGVTGAYKQVHQPGATTAKTMTLQKGAPQSDGTVKPYTYVGCKVADWEIACTVGNWLTLQVGIDGWDELTLATSPASNALATASYPVGVGEFNFVQGGLYSGGTASTTTGLVSVASGSLMAKVKGFGVKSTTPLANDRFFFGTGGVKDEQIENDFRTITGSLATEFASQAAIYDAYRADTQTVLRLLFTGPAIGASNYSLEIILPWINYDGESPKIGGPGLVDLTAPFSVSDDSTNAVIQITYVSTDTAI